MLQIPRLTGVVAVIVVLATVGVGYAAFSTAAYLQGSSSAGTLGPLVWGNGPTSTGYAVNDVCSAVVGTTTSTGDTLIVAAGELLPGDYCTYGDTLTLDGGSLPATLTAEVTTATGGLCPVLHYADSFFTYSIAIGSGGQTGNTWHQLEPGHSMNWAGTVSLPSTVGNSYQGLSCSFTVTLVGTVGT